MRNFNLSKNKTSFFFNRTALALYARLRVYILSITCMFFPSKNNINIKIKNNPNQLGNEKIARRLFESYKKMKTEEKKNVLSPSLMWKKHLEKNYLKLIESYKENNFEKFNYFINNFGQFKNYLGLTINVMISKFFFRNIYIKKIIFDNQLTNWIFFNKYKSIKSLHSPTFGNPKGAVLNNSTFVSYTSFFNEIYGSMAAGLIKDIKHPLIAEIGGGRGETAYFILKDLKKATYIDLDIPEVLILSAFFLMNSFPKKKTYLYGEKNFSFYSLKKYDLVFLPQSSIKKIKNSSVNIFFNKCSLGEMNKKTVKAYISEIERISDGYFFHLNQDFHYRNFNSKERNLLASEYPIDAKKFNLLFRYLDVSGFVHDKFLNYGNDIFIYIYKKIIHK
jgi:putative sugar O-methyltransferase